MTGRLYHTVERRFGQLLHLEACSLGLLLGKGNAATMFVTVVMPVSRMVLAVFVSVGSMVMGSMVVIVTGTIVAVARMVVLMVMGSMVMVVS